MTYDDWKLASPYDDDFCSECGDKLTKYEECICENCENKLKKEKEDGEETPL
jgi:predicted amidophosphoribosyltransferase